MLDNCGKEVHLTRHKKDAHSQYRIISSTHRCDSKGGKPSRTPYAWIKCLNTGLMACVCQQCKQMQQDVLCAP